MSQTRKKYVDLGGVQVDTARIYSAGETELILGRILPQFSSRTGVGGVWFSSERKGRVVFYSFFVGRISLLIYSE